MAIPLHTNINTNAPRPLDSKTIVGIGQEYTSKDSIPSNYRFKGMRVYDTNTKIEWELVPMSGNNININEFENAGTIGITDDIYYWKNISFGATPMFFKNNIWLNENNINMSTSSGDVLLTAITFGEVKKVLWTITRFGSQQEVFKKETITKTFSAGNYIIKFEAFDIYGNSIAYNFTMNVTTVGVLGIETFTVAPSAGINNNTGVKRTYNFNLVTTEPIVADQLQTLSISFTNQLLQATSIPLISGTTFINAVTALSSTSLYINGSLIPELNNIELNANTVFTLTLQKYQEAELTATATYTSVDKIVVSSGTVTYNQTTKQLSSTITLQTAYTSLSAVDGSFIISGTTYNYVASPDNRTFTFVQTNININPGTYNINATMIQTVATGVGTNTETHTLIHPMTLVVAEPTYLVSIVLYDDLNSPEIVPEATVVIRNFGVLVTQSTTNVSGVATFNLPASIGYSAQASKSNYITTQSIPFTVDGIETINITILPDRSITNVGLTNCNPGATTTVNYTLLPASKYEDDCDIYYEIKLGETLITSGTRNKITNGVNFNQIALNAGWDGYTIEGTVTSYYKINNVMGTFSQTIGERAPKYGYVVIENPTTKTLANVLSTQFDEDIIINSTELIVTSQNEPLIEWVSIAPPLTFAYGWVAFPSSYPEYVQFKDKDEGTYQNMNSGYNQIYKSDFTVYGETYKFYIFSGNDADNNYPNFGTETVLLNFYFKI